MAREIVRATLEELRREALQKTTDEIIKAESALAELNQLIQRLAELDLPASSGAQHRQQAEEVLKEAKQLKAQETYFELLDAEVKAKEVQQICEQGIVALSSGLEEELRTLQQDHENAQRELEAQRQRQLNEMQRSLESWLKERRWEINSIKNRAYDKMQKREAVYSKISSDLWERGGCFFLGCPIGCSSYLWILILSETVFKPVFSSIIGEDKDPVGYIFVFSLALGIMSPIIVWICALISSALAKQEYTRIQQECDHRMAALKQKYREELERQQRGINDLAEQEIKALRERFERRRAEIECMMNELEQKREALARLLTRG